MRRLKDEQQLTDLDLKQNHKKSVAEKEYESLIDIHRGKHLVRYCGVLLLCCVCGESKTNNRKKESLGNLFRFQCAYQCY